MDSERAGPLREYVAAALEAQGTAISEEWLLALSEVLDEELRDIFPTALLLDHIPELIRELANIVRAPANGTALASSTITLKAQELGRLRHEQGATIHQLLREYDILARLIDDAIRTALESLPGGADVSSGMQVAGSAGQAVRMILQATVDEFVDRYASTIDAQTKTLSAFNDFVSHELKKPLHAALLNIDLVLACSADANDAPRELHVAKQNIRQAANLLDDIEGLAHVESGAATSPVVGDVDIRKLVCDVGQQLAEMISLHDITLDVADGLGTVTTAEAKLELIITNLLANAVKYSDPAKPQRWIRVDSPPAAGPTHVVLRIADNGIGIREAIRDRVFDLRVRGVEGTQADTIDGHGLGLFLARRAATDLGGDITFESVEGEGSAFSVILPLEREPDSPVRK